MRSSSSSIFAISLATLALYGFGCSPATPSNAPAPTQPTATSTPTTPTTTPTSTPATKPTTTPVKPKTTTTAPKPTTAPHTYTITIVGMQFSPLVLAIHAGDTVVWVNKDTTPHTTKADQGLLWDSGTIYPGGKFSHTFKATGGYTYSCGIHPTMHGNIIVR